MKKFIITLLTICSIPFIAEAQDKGDKYIGGIIGAKFSSTSIAGESATSAGFEIMPEFGAFVANRFRIGGAIGYGLATSDGIKAHSLIVEPKIAYYAKLCNGLYYTPEFGVGLCYSSSEGVGGIGAGIDLTVAALEFRPTQHFGLSVNLLSLQYIFLSYSDYGFNSNSLNFNIGIQSSIGLRYYF